VSGAREGGPDIFFSTGLRAHVARATIVAVDSGRNANLLHSLRARSHCSFALACMVTACQAQATETSPARPPDSDPFPSVQQPSAQPVPRSDPKATAVDPRAPGRDAGAKSQLVDPVVAAEASKKKPGKPADAKPGVRDKCRPGAKSNERAASRCLDDPGPATGPEDW
jgi:hypothetical protein